MKAGKTSAIAEAQGKQTWQKTKSQLTRNAILEAAVDSFYQRGYNNTTTEHITQLAGVSRGAMLHHFPSRFDLIRATVEYLNQQRIEMFAREEFAVQQGAEHTRIEEGIDIYWQQLNTPAFIVFSELRVAARSDPELAEVVKPALQAFETAWYEAVKEIFPDLALSEAFSRANYLTKYMLEGMALAKTSDAGKIPERMMLDWLKRELRRSFQDVREVKRTERDP